MYLVYSALQQEPPPGACEATHLEKQLRYEAYRAVCEKYKHEIAAIRKYLPNWKPRFEQ